MAELATIARPYAEAAFRLARQENALAAWSGQLALIASVYQDPQMRAAMANPKVSYAEVERLLLAICGDRVSAPARNLIQLLVHNRRLEALPEIRALFDELKLQDEGMVDARISSASASHIATIAARSMVSSCTSTYRSGLTAGAAPTSDLATPAIASPATWTMISRPAGWSPAAATTAKSGAITSRTRQALSTAA